MQEVVLVAELSKEDIDKLSPEAKLDKTLEIQESIKELEQGLANEKSFIHKAALGTQRDFFEDWTKYIEQLIYLEKAPRWFDKFEDPMKEVSTFIRAKIGELPLKADKKETLYHNLDRNIDSKFKHSYGENPQNEENNTSEIPASDFMRFSLANYVLYHKRMAEVGETLFNHLADPEIHKDFNNVTEWRDIILMVSALASLTKISTDIEKLQNGKFEQTSHKGHGVVDQIEDELNIRESATTLQKATMFLLAADHSFRRMAHKFGVSPRQNQRIRKRMQDWGKKDAAKIIRDVISSYQCVKCGFNPVTNRTHDEIKMFNEETWIKIKYGDKIFPIPDKYKKQNLSPIQIAEKLFAKQIKLE